MALRSPPTIGWSGSIDAIAVHRLACGPHADPVVAAYLAHLNNASSADFLRVRVNDVAAGWQTATIGVEAGHAAGTGLVEAAVDDVRISQAEPVTIRRSGALQ